MNPVLLLIGLALFAMASGRNVAPRRKSRARDRAFRADRPIGMHYDPISKSYKPYQS